jgi:hypothetical protein
MENQIVLKESINQILREKLESFGCITGKFEFSINEMSVHISMYGIKESKGKGISFFEWENSFKKIVRNYFDSSVPELASCIIQINLIDNTFTYENFDVEQYKAKRIKEKEKQEEQENERNLNYKKFLASQTTEYGKTLAKSIADAFKPGVYISYSHRDYCGMGLGMNYKNEYVYGAIWDSWLNEDKVFATKVEFVDWLSQQSDASLANLEGDPFAWGNQVITRKRLEEFLENRV